MTILAKSIAAANVSFNRTFQQSLEKVKPWHSLLAKLVTSTGKGELYGWEDLSPRLKEWIGPRQFERIRQHEIYVANKHYERSVSVKRTLLEDDLLGVFRTENERIARYTEAAAKNTDYSVLDILLYGETGGDYVTYDGQSYFGTHPIDMFDPASDTVVNWETSKNLTPTNYDAAIEKFATQRDYAGNSLGVMPDTLIVGPKTRQAGKSIVKAETIVEVVAGTGVASVANTRAGEVSLLFLPELGTSKRWFLAHLGSEYNRGIAVQIRQKARIARMTDPNNTFTFLHDEYAWGVDERHAAKGILWQTLHGYQGT
jgi:phage major head subunit gpT-like protein